MRFRLTEQFHAYRGAMQGALEGLAGTVFRPYVTGGAGGLRLEMLTDADHTARLATDDAGGGPVTVDAGHLHAEGANAADLQSMMWDVYQYQATSADGDQLVGDMVAGTNMNFDIRMVAVNASPTVSHDAFVSNEVDLADLHAEHQVPPAGHSGHPQSQQSVYAHFMHERYYDATHSGSDMTAIATNFQNLDARRAALQARFNAFPANVVAALQGNPATPPLTPGQIATAQAYAGAVSAFNTAWTTNQAAFDARFMAAHSDAIDRENDFNRERGFDDSRPH